MNKLMFSADNKPLTILSIMVGNDETIESTTLTIRSIVEAIKSGNTSSQNSGIISITISARPLTKSPLPLSACNIVGKKFEA